MLLERAHEGVLVRRGLEATVTELGAGIDELQLDVLERLSLGVDQERLDKKIDAEIRLLILRIMANVRFFAKCNK